MKTTEYFPVAQIIRERRSIKKFKPDPVSEELICELLNVAVWAPNHRIREPWRFTLFVGEGKKTVVEAIIHNAVKRRDPDMLMKVPAYLAVSVREDERQREWDEDVFACAALIQNFQLAAWERGLGAVWLTEPFTYQPGFRQSIGVKPDEKLIGLLQIGYPEVIPPAVQRTPAEEKLTVIRDSTNS
ncbi:nitroreductase family protein [Brevibacillus borstelensis]|uniref:nitroreductase family protein n=1 Tax=Brevibacillus borstelensis TaxID=45462 RepID=UPI0030C173B3